MSLTILVIFSTEIYEIACNSPAAKVFHWNPIVQYIMTQSGPDVGRPEPPIEGAALLGDPI